MKSILAPLLWPTMILVALADLLIVDLGSILPRVDLPEAFSRLPDMQARWSPVIGHLTRITAALLLVFLLPALARGTHRRRTSLDACFVVLGLISLGLAVLSTAIQDARFATVQNVVLAAAEAVVVIEIARGPLTPRARIPATVFVAALALPHVWRAAFELLGRDLEALRDIADALIIIGLAGLNLVPSSAGRARLVITAVPAVALAACLWIAPTESRDILMTMTGLWLTSLPDGLQVVLISLGLWATVRLVADLAIGRENAGIGLAVFLIGCAGLIPSQWRCEEFLLVLVALVPASAWGVGRSQTRAELVQLF